jgi:hypothetical protein
MEHRWGTRKPVLLRVTLTTAGGVAAAGVLRDISVSGAFIATEVPMNLHEQIKLTVYGGPHRRKQLGSFDAHVVRKTPRADKDKGIGIEWSELAPQSLSMLEREGRVAPERPDGAGDGDRAPEGHRHRAQSRTRLSQPGTFQSQADDETAAVPPRESGLRRRGSRLR